MGRGWRGFRSFPLPSALAGCRCNLLVRIRLERVGEMLFLRAGHWHVDASELPMLPAPPMVRTVADHHDVMTVTCDIHSLSSLLITAVCRRPRLCCANTACWALRGHDHGARQPPPPQGSCSCHNRWCGALCCGFPVARRRHPPRRASAVAPDFWDAGAGHAQRMGCQQLRQCRPTQHKQQQQPQPQQWPVAVVGRVAVPSAAGERPGASPCDKRC